MEGDPPLVHGEGILRQRRHVPVIHVFGHFPAKGSLGHGFHLTDGFRRVGKETIQRQLFAVGKIVGQGRLALFPAASCLLFLHGQQRRKDPFIPEALIIGLYTAARRQFDQQGRDIAGLHYVVVDLLLHRRIGEAGKLRIADLAFSHRRGNLLYLYGLRLAKGHSGNHQKNQQKSCQPCTHPPSSPFPDRCEKVCETILP